MKNFGRIALLTAILILAAGCHRRPLYDMYDKVSFKVTIDVDTVANIMANIYNDQIEKPSTNTDALRVMVYEANNHNFITTGFLYDKSYDAAGHQVFDGTMNIYQGNFDILIYNFDTPYTLIKEDNNTESITAYTAVSSKSAGTKADEDSYMGLKIYDQPDHLMVAHLKNYRVAPHDDITGINATCYTCLNTYYIQIHVTGMQYASSAYATISGLHSGNRFGREKDQNIGIGERISDPSASVYFKLEKSTDKNIPGENKDVLCALFNTFGKVPDLGSDLYVTFNVVDTQGNLLQKQVNMNRIWKTEDAIERHWLLIDEIWDIPNPRPVPPVSNGGFQPVVDDWDIQRGEILL